LLFKKPASKLSFLGFGGPTLTTWGRMINQAMNFGGFARLAWWRIFSPAFAIMLLCAGFVFISHALDQILNPRLRRRRWITPLEVETLIILNACNGAVI